MFYTIEDIDGDIHLINSTEIVHLWSNGFIINIIYKGSDTIHTILHKEAKRIVKELSERIIENQNLP